MNKPILSRAFRALGISASLAGASSAPAAADDFQPYSSTNVQYLYGKGYDLQPTETMHTLTLEHYSTWKYGDNYFFVDLYDQGLDTQTYYAEWFPSVSLNRLMSFNPGPLLSDIHAVGSINITENYRVWLAGFGVNFKVPGFDVLRLDGFYLHHELLGYETYQITPTWDTTWRFDPKLHVRFRGYADIVGKGVGGKPYILTDPQLLVDVGNAMGLAPGRFYSGIEYRYWQNKFGVDGTDEQVVQAMAAWFF